MLKAEHKTRLRRAESGQSLLEMALAMVILVTLLSALLDLGRLYFTYLALEDAVGEAALYLSLRPQCVNNEDNPSPGCADPNNAEWRAEHAVGGRIVDWDRVELTICMAGDCVGPYDYDNIGIGGPVSVEMEYQFQLLTPIFPKFVGLNPVPLKVFASQTIISNNYE